MELIVFDLDGTLLNSRSEISDYTSETLRLLGAKGIAYTVATGRTLHGARSVLEGHRFELPQVYKNGVMVWHPKDECFAGGATLTANELTAVVDACEQNELTPFVFTLDDDNESTVYHTPISSKVERELLKAIDVEQHVRARDLAELCDDKRITHVNALGRPDAIEAVVSRVRDEAHLVAYSGVALEGKPWRWLDIHHHAASKGGAVEDMRRLLGVERVICFGDSDNDLSMFETADESYAPANAKDAVKAAATAVIGHHDEEGIARFLRERFELG